MKRRYFDNLNEHYLGLILDCLYYCWRKKEISDDEYYLCYKSLDLEKLFYL